MNASEKTKPNPKRSAKVIGPPSTHALVTIYTYVKWFAGVIIALSAAVAAWIYLEFPILATHGFVSDQLKPVYHHIDSVSKSLFENKVETINGQRERALAEKFELDFKSRSVTDPTSGQIIQRRIQEVNDKLRELETSISDTKAEIKNVENHKH